MKNGTFKTSDSISLLSFLDNSKTVCGSDGTHESPVIWLFPHFVCEPAKAALLQWLTAENTKNHERKGKITKFCKVVGYLLKLYATDDVIVETYAEVVSFKTSARMIAVRYSEVIWEKVL